MKEIKVISLSEGIGMGEAFEYKKTSAENNGEIRTPDEEKKRYKAAVDKYCEETSANAENIREKSDSKTAEILFSHISLARDTYSEKSVFDLIEKGMSAEDAAQKVWDDWKEALCASEDSLIKERSADAEDIKNGILSALSGKTEELIPEGSVIICEEFTPSLAAKSINAAAVLAKRGGITSHGAILARSMGLPLAVCSDIPENINGKTVICDTKNSLAVFEPLFEIISKYKLIVENEKREREENKRFAHTEILNEKGEKIEIFTNAGSLFDVEEGIKCGSDGVGLFRTEFLFTGRENAPSEEEQFEIYKSAAEKLCGRPLIIRTLDIGGDKKIPYLNIPEEENPFLGVRGIRFCLTNKEIFKVQLRAILRASVFGNIQIMLPMISVGREIKEAKEIISACRKALRGEGYAVSESIPVGIMAETPSVALCADAFAETADFFSIGTNDLTQYIMASDRGNGGVSDLYSPNYNAVRKAVSMIVKAARKANIPCHVCGEAATDKSFLSFLLSLEVKEISVSPSKVGEVKRIITGEQKKEMLAIM